ncbi:DUF3426 domain-containing protein [Porticoccaceae bacterium LTM1]|nr:DUF3426 domain-containing protein [Porticoccaceae bacterium LTM1]
MEFITRCPACQIAFRVTATQLKLASGRVRCGACLTIFNAEQHRQDVEPEPSDQQQDEYKNQLEVQRLATESLARSRQNRQQAEAQSSFELEDDQAENKEQEDDWLIHDDMDRSPDSVLDSESEPTSGDQPDSTELEPATGQAMAEEKPEQDYDGDLADLPTEAPIATESASSTVSDVLTAESEQAIVESEKAALESEKAALESEKAALESEKAALESEEAPQDCETLLTTELDHPPIDPEHRLDAPEPPHEPAINVLPDGDGPIPLGSDSAEFIPEAIEADPDSPFTATKARPKQRRPLTIAACLLALVALPTQYIYFNYDALIQNPQYRTWIEPVTSKLGIKLPQLVNLDLILSQHLMVISHPTEPDALLVEAVLINKAGFDQSFPDLLLKFENVQGVPVAERRFSPSEYLSGELTADSPFPSQRPVRIRLSIVDPGPNATNYQLLISK